MTGAQTITDLPRLAPRAADAHKGDFGRVLVIAGSRGMAGAAVLTGTAALRGGAGLVQVAVPSDILTAVAIGNPCYMTAGLQSDQEGRFAESAVDGLIALAGRADVVALGPGLGRSDSLDRLVVRLVEEVAAPLVLDADGLNALAGSRATAVIGLAEALRTRKAPTVLTPHPGEFGRLVGKSIDVVQGQREELAARFATDHDVVVLLKGAATVVTDGKGLYRNATGNPGMATGGSGDVLTGLIAALVGQKLDPFAAARLGAHLHGRAGDLARDALGEVALIATDLLEYLPRAFVEHGRSANP